MNRYHQAGHKGGSNQSLRSQILAIPFFAILVFQWLASLSKEERIPSFTTGPGPFIPTSAKGSAKSEESHFQPVSKTIMTGQNRPNFVTSMTPCSLKFVWKKSTHRLSRYGQEARRSQCVSSVPSSRRSSLKNKLIVLMIASFVS